LDLSPSGRGRLANGVSKSGEGGRAYRESLSPLTPTLSPMGRGRREAVNHSGRMPADFTTLPHFAVSAATEAPNSDGLAIMGMVPTSARRAWIAWVARPALISRLSRAMISGGVPFGTPTPPHVPASYPGSVSAMLGTSGRPS